jgi:hypothetical protein
MAQFVALFRRVRAIVFSVGQMSSRGYRFGDAFGNLTGTWDAVQAGLDAARHYEPRVQATRLKSIIGGAYAGAVLTPFGADLLEHYRRILAAAETATAADLVALGRAALRDADPKV